MNLYSIAIWIVGSFGIWVFYGLLALWISSRRWHWSVRVAILMVSVTPILAIEAPDLMLMLLASHLTIFGPVAFVAVRANDEARAVSIADSLARWSLTDLLLGTAIAAGMISLLLFDLSEQDISAVSAIGYGVAVGVSILVGIAIGRSRFRWRTWFAALTGLALLLILWFAFGTGFQLTTVSQFNTLAWGEILGLTFTTPVASAVVIAHVVFYYHARLRAIACAKEDSAFSTKLRKAFAFSTYWVSIVGMMFVALLTAVLYSALLTRYSQIEVQARFEEPNGYHALVDAGAAFSKSQIFDGAADFLPGKTVRKEIQNYASTFAQVEEALKQNCLIAAKDGKVDPSDPFSGATDGMASMRSIARALRVKSRQAMSDDDPDAALGDAIQCLKLKLPLSRAQLLVGELVAVAVEGIGADMAYATIEDASDESLQDTLKVLSELEALPQDVELIRDREQQRLWQHGNWKYRLAILSWVDDDVNFQVDQAIKRNTACRRQLVLAICLELYRRENDALPNALEELVPGYIAEIPEDPFAIDPAQPLKYCVGEDGRYTLYSVGGDGQDNAGRLDADQYWNTEGSDINFAECCRINRIEFLRNAQLGRLDSVQAEE